MSTGTLIVGASQAGVELAVTLRAALPDEPIALVGSESLLPYQRPPLSKAVLAQPEIPPPLELRSRDFLSKMGIELLLGQRVIDAVLQPGTGGVAVTDGGARLEFKRLALAVGARPRRLGVPGAEVEGVQVLRTYDDARRLRERAAAAQQVVVVGAGFVGLEVAAALNALGKQVVVIEYADRILPRALSADLAAQLMAAHLSRGIDIRLRTGVVEIVASEGAVSGVELSDGSRVPSQLVVVGIGATPRTELAELMGVDCAGGVLVDECSRTTISGVVAAGDCTITRLDGDPSTDLRLESVQNAVSQARAAAATLAGRPQPNLDLPWFWSDQADLKLQIAGSIDAERHVLRTSDVADQFSALYYRSDRLVGVAAVNAPADYVAAKHVLLTGKTIPFEQAADPKIPLKTLISS